MNPNVFVATVPIVIMGSITDVELHTISSMHEMIILRRIIMWPGWVRCASIPRQSRGGSSSEGQCESKAAPILPPRRGAEKLARCVVRCMGCPCCSEVETQRRCQCDRGCVATWWRAHVVAALFVLCSVFWNCHCVECRAVAVYFVIQIVASSAVLWFCFVLHCQLYVHKLSHVRSI